MLKSPETENLFDSPQSKRRDFKGKFDDLKQGKEIE